MATIGDRALNSSFKSLPETRWTLIARASASDQEALGELLKLYMPALRTHLVYQRGIAPGDADDLLQAFVMKKMLERSLLAQARKDCGRFRNYVLRALGNFVTDWWREQRRDVQAVSLGDAADPPAREGEGSDVAETAFAAEVVHEALRRAKARCEERHLMDAWRVFDSQVLGPILRDEPAERYASLVVRMKLSSPQKASNLLVTAKRIFERCVRDVVDGYIQGETQDTDSEIDTLRRILKKRSKGGSARGEENDATR